MKILISILIMVATPVITQKLVKVNVLLDSIC
jgi:hypothetical protein